MKVLYQVTWPSLNASYPQCNKTHESCVWGSGAILWPSVDIILALAVHWLLTKFGSTIPYSYGHLVTIWGPCDTDRKQGHLRHQGCHTLHSQNVKKDTGMNNLVNHQKESSDKEGNEKGPTSASTNTSPRRTRRSQGEPAYKTKQDSSNMNFKQQNMNYTEWNHSQRQCSLSETEVEKFEV